LATQPRGTRYSRDEWIVLLDYFYSEPEPTHTDSHPQLVDFARRLRRPPGSVDANLRTIKLALTKSAGFEHGARLMREVVSKYRHDRGTLSSDAAAARSRVLGP